MVHIIPLSIAQRRLDTGNAPQYPQGSSIGGHAMHVIGCDDSKQVLGQTGAFEVQNSWGPEWGDAGYCWIPYSYFAAVEGEWDFWMAHFGRPWMVKQ